MDADQELLFKDLGATAKQTVEQVRGLEESYFSLLQKTMSGSKVLLSAQICGFLASLSRCERTSKISIEFRWNSGI